MQQFRLIFLIVFLFMISACSTTSIETPKTLSQPTATLFPTATSRPTATPFPEVDLDSFVFPYDVPQVTNIWNQINLPNQFRYISYHIANRPDRSIPYEDSCGYHPGDQISLLHSNKYYENFLMDVKMPYSGKLKISWITDGNDDAFVFLLGSNNGKVVYLNAYHTTHSNISIGQFLKQEDIFGSFSYTRDHCNCGYYEATLHLTLYNPAPDGGNNFLEDEINVLEISKYAFPSTLQAAYQNDIKLLITYQGPNYCDMTPQQKIDEILTFYLPNAGFCVEGVIIKYCGSNTEFAELEFRYKKWSDSRSIMLTPVK